MMFTLTPGNADLQTEEQGGKLEMKIKNNALKGISKVTILASNVRTFHFHLLVPEAETGKLRLEKVWPGIIKKHKINKYQAEWMKKTHSENYIFKEGPQQGGNISTSI